MEHRSDMIFGREKLGDRTERSCGEKFSTNGRQRRNVNGAILNICNHTRTETKNSLQGLFVLPLFFFVVDIKKAGKC